MRWLALAAAALPLTACGATSAVGTPVAQAATKTAGTGSEHVEYTGSVTVAGQKMQLSGAGDFQNDPQLGSMTMTLNGTGQHAQIDAVMKDSTIWMRSPLFAKALPAGKTWLSIDLKKAGKQFGVNFGQFAQESPTDTLAALEKGGTVTKVGQETIGGERTTHYKAQIDPSKFATLKGANPVPVDVWIGSDGLLRRLTESYSTTAGGQSTATSMTMNLSKLGEQVAVQVPGAGETLDMTKLGG